MSGPIGSSQWMYNSSTGFYSFSIDQSLRFNDDDSAYLSRTPSSDGNRQTFTISFWMKRANIGIDQMRILNSNFGSDAVFDLYFEDTDEIVFRSRSRNTNGAAFDWSRKSVRKFRDVSSWYHIVIAVDVTVSSPSSQLDLFNFYLNGENITSNFTNVVNSERAATSSQVDQRWNSTTTHDIGYNGSSQYFDGYLAEFHNVDGTALSPTSFGETINGVWVPKAYSGSYGTNGFYLPFDDSSAIGDDESGNTNDWTANNLAASDVVPDSPTNNFATLIPMANISLSEGNLKMTTSRTGNWDGTIGSFGVTSGKWYYEVRMSATEGTFRCVAGWQGNQASQTVTYNGKGASGSPYGTLFDNYLVNVFTTSYYKDGGTDGTMTAASSGDVINVAADFDNGKIYFGINGTYYANDGGTDGDPAGGTNESLSGIDLTASEYVPAFHIRSDSSAGGNVMIVNFGQEGTFAGTETDGGYSDGNGYGSFFNPVPSGFLALNSANLPEPTLSPNAAEQADDYFNTVLWSGDGASSRAITGIGHAPDFVWIKTRNQANEHSLFDSVRGVAKDLESNSTATEQTDNQYGYINSFDSDGFTVVKGSNSNPALVNASGNTFVAWNWKAGGTAVSNTDGSITSSVSAAPDAGFSIVTWVGNNTDGATVGHGLTDPEFSIVKNRDSATNWDVCWSGFTSGTSLNLDTTAAEFSPTTGYQQLGTSTITLKNGGVGIGRVNGTPDDYVAYVFKSVPGFSKVGSYVGNANADGTFVYTGFRPAFLLWKNASATTVWVIFDAVRNTFNYADLQLRPNENTAEIDGGASYGIDLLSNGFKVRSSDSNFNGSGNTIIYLAFAEAPFKYANAR